MTTLVSALKGLLLLTVCFALTGCPVQWKFVFINATSEPLQVQYSGYKPLVIPSGESRKELQHFYPPPRSIFSKQSPPTKPMSTITVSTVGGTRLYSANGDELIKTVWYTAKYPYVYVRVTRTEIKALPTLEEARR